MEHDEALMKVNVLQNQLSGLARAIATALQDGRVSAWEGMALSMRGMTMATTIMTLLQGLSPEARADLLYVLEHGQWTMLGGGPTVP